MAICMPGRALTILMPVLLSGCASMLNKGNQSVVVNSDPPGAILFANGRELGTTPFTYTLENGQADQVDMELRMEGREPASFRLRPKIKGGVLLADAMLLGIPYLVDAKSNALYSVGKKEVNVHLYKTLPTDRQRLELPVLPLESSLAPNTVPGRYGPSKLTATSKELGGLNYPRQGTAAMLQGLAHTFVDAYMAQPGTAKGDQDIQRAKVLLRPVVKAVNLEMEGSRRKVAGTSHVEVDWRFYSGIAKDSLLFSVQTASDRMYEDAYPTDVLGDALQDAARRLLDEEGLYERLAEVRSKGLSLSKGRLLSLAAPVPIKFEDRRAMFPALVKAVVTVEMKEGHGSGFLISNDGYLLTNAHVVGTESTAKVRFEQGFSLEGQVMKVNRDFDLALVKVPGNDLPALTLGDDADLVLGEELFAIGTPLDERLGQSLSRGIMSGRREIDGHRYLQTDVSINPGNSGGPLLNDQGKVMGIATMKAKAVGVEGIGFGVPVSTALEMLNIEFRP